LNEKQPIFMQIIGIIENGILTGTYKTDDLIISTTQISKLYSVNPTTAVKAIGKLADDGILYRKRGIGMCVSDGAREKIAKRRKDAFLNQTIGALLAEAETLDIPLDELIKRLKSKGENHD